jgi:hypothetical protein
LIFDYIFLGTTWANERGQAFVDGVLVWEQAYTAADFTIRDCGTQARVYR